MASVEICNDKDAPKSSILWAVFDPTNRNAQRFARSLIKQQLPPHIGSTIQIVTDDLITTQWAQLSSRYSNIDIHEWYPELSLTDQIAISQMRTYLPFVRANLASETVFDIDENNIRSLADAIITNAPIEQIPRDKRKEFKEKIPEIRENIILGMADMEKQLNSSPVIASAFYRFWDYARFRSHIKRAFKTEPAKVFRIDASRRVSPRVSTTGNLYIDSVFWSSLSDTERYLVLNHEAAHITGLQFEYAAGNLDLFIDDFVTSSSPNQDTDLNKIRTDLLTIARTPDESIIDLIALVYSMSGTREIDEYKELMNRVERNNPSRVRIINRMSEYTHAGYDLKRILTYRMKDNLRPCGQGRQISSGQAHLSIMPEFNYIDNEERRLLSRYRSAANEYLAERVVSLMEQTAGGFRDDIPDPGNIIYRQFQSAGFTKLTVTDEALGKKTYCFSGVS